MQPVTPLTRARVVKIASIGLGPFCGMMLADHGVEVRGLPIGEADFLLRGRIAEDIDLKSGARRDRCLATR
jgi:alpha-methylacyl-CoA racemase